MNSFSSTLQYVLDNKSPMKPSRTTLDLQQPAASSDAPAATAGTPVESDLPGWLANYLGKGDPLKGQMLMEYVLNPKATAPSPGYQ